MYTRLARNRIRVEDASPAYLGLWIIYKIFREIWTSDALPYTSGTRIPFLLGVKNYLNNYFAMYRSLTHTRIRAELASSAYLGLGIF